MVRLKRRKRIPDDLWILIYLWLFLIAAMAIMWFWYVERAPWV